MKTFYIFLLLIGLNYCFGFSQTKLQFSDTIEVSTIDSISIKFLSIGNKDMVVINDDSTYKNFFENNSIKKVIYFNRTSKWDSVLLALEAYNLPTIDFSTKTLIIINVSGVGCRKPIFSTKLLSIPSTRKYILNVDILSYGTMTTGLNGENVIETCMTKHSKNIVIISDKLDNNYYIEKIENKKLIPIN